LGRESGLSLHEAGLFSKSRTKIPLRQGDVGLVLEDAKGFSHVLWKKNLEDRNISVSQPGKVTSLKNQDVFSRVKGTL